ncbi:unnamed protein product [Urochloa decumbens]|uniref:F-box domain-containing protein n=1 Tax=Urochloa decumbens TaxID=240449 RepID=A0ABC9FAG9_9POAL
MAAHIDLPVAVGGGEDRLSDLPDGILEHVLSFLPAEDAVRSSVLSRRWRGAWARASALNLSDARHQHQGRFLAFARAVLARYGARDIPALNVAIGFASSVGPRSGTAAAWLRDAMERVVGSISVSVTAPGPMDRPLVLPRRLRATSISLTLSGDLYENGELVLPEQPCEAAAFGSLVELNLSRARLQGGSSLGEFLSSCCPRLRLLRLCRVSDGRHRHVPWPMALRMDQLEELELYGIESLSELQVVAANLRVLVVRHCFHSLAQWDTDTAVQISAPRLQNITWLGGLPRRLSFLTDCRCVQRLALGFQSYEFDGRGFQRRGNAMQLLEMCPGASHLNVCIDTSDGAVRPTLPVDLQIPHIPNIRSLSLRIAGSLCFVDYHITPSVFFFLRQCLNLTRLHIDLSTLHQASQSDQDHLVLPDEYENLKKPQQSSDRDLWKGWRDHLQLGLLQEIRISGFMGSDREMELADLLFGVRAARPALERISVTFPPIGRLPDGSLMWGVDGSRPAFERISLSIGELMELMDGIAVKMKSQFPLMGGRWESNATKGVTWTRMSLICNGIAPLQ